VFPKPFNRNRCDTAEGTRTAQPGNTSRIGEIKTTISKFLVIELDSDTSVPRVFYEGQEIQRKININFNWETKKGNNQGYLNFTADYYEKDSNDYPIQKGIKYKRK
jgi:hypothetical protein